MQPGQERTSRRDSNVREPSALTTGLSQRGSEFEPAAQIICREATYRDNLGLKVQGQEHNNLGLSRG